VRAKQKYRHFNRLTPFWDFVVTTIMVIAALLTLMPVILVVIISFSSAESIAMKGYRFIPDGWSLEAYKAVLKSGKQILDSYIVTIAHTTIGTVSSLAVMSMFAFALSQKKFKARRFLTFFTFFTMLFSGGLVPSYIINVRYLNLYDNFLIFILPSLVSAYHVIILRTFIMTTIPDTMIEAGRIDGASDFIVFLKIVLPLFKPGLATIGLFNIVARWNEWFIGMLYISNPKLVPLQTMLTKIQQNIDFLKQSIGTSVGSEEMLEALKSMPSDSVRMATTIISVLPVMMIYPFFQRYFIKGLTIGSIKG